MLTSGLVWAATAPLVLSAVLQAVLAALLAAFGVTGVWLLVGLLGGGPRAGRVMGLLAWLPWFVLLPWLATGSAGLALGLLPLLAALPPLWRQSRMALWQPTNEQETLLAFYGGGGAWRRRMLGQALGHALGPAVLWAVSAVIAMGALSGEGLGGALLRWARLGAWDETLATLLLLTVNLVLLGLVLGYLGRQPRPPRNVTPPGAANSAVPGAG